MPPLGPRVYSSSLSKPYYKSNNDSRDNKTKAITSQPKQHTETSNQTIHNSQPKKHTEISNQTIQNPLPEHNGLFSSIINGFSFGTGSSLAHRIFGSKQIHNNTIPKENTERCKIEHNAYLDCIMIEKNGCEVNYDKFEDYEKCIEIKTNGCSNFKKAYDECLLKIV